MIFSRSSSYGRWLATLLALATGVATAASTAQAQSPNTTVNAFGSLTFDFPIAVRTPPGVTDRTFVLERNFGIQMVDLTNNTKTPFMNLAAYLGAGDGDPTTSLETDGECGILGLAFHPQYNQNGYFYMFYSMQLGGALHQRIARFKATGTAGQYNQATSADPATCRPLITQRDEAQNHNGGDLAFGPDGYLYISVGDEGGSDDPFGNTRFIDRDFFAGILRIDVDRKKGNIAPNPHKMRGSVLPTAVHAGAYRIPQDNPFINKRRWHGRKLDPKRIRTELFSAGMRNPWRISFDSEDGRFFVGDVGQGAREEVNLVTRGGDYGWARREGSLVNNNGPYGAQDPPQFNPRAPVDEYGRDLGSSITGGFVYRGTEFPDIVGAYIFGDFGSGRIWALEQNTTTGVWTRTQLMQLPGFQVVGFGVDPRDANILICRTNGVVSALELVN